MKIATKIIVISAVLAAIFLGTSYGYLIKRTRDQLLREVGRVLELEADSEARIISSQFEGIQNTVLAVRATPPFQGIIRAEQGGGYDEVGASTAQQWKERLQTIFIAEGEANAVYDQLRYIDESGQEIVRVDFVDGEAQVIPEDKLQNKAGRNYFKEALLKSDGEVYVSKTELNREGAPPVISVPYRPVIRVSTPIYDRIIGGFKGVLVANINVESIVRQSGLHDSSDRLFYLTDTEGYFIHHPDPEKEWGGPNNLNTGFSLRTEFPALNSEDFDDTERELKPNSNTYIYFSKIQPDKSDFSRSWNLLDVVPATRIVGPINATAYGAASVGFGVFILLFLIFRFSIRYLLDPLDDLAEASEKLGEGNFDVQAPVVSNDEIGRVASAFNQMARQLKVLYESLEKQVAIKTSNLKTKVRELERTKTAMVNVLDDIESEKQKFETVLESIGDGVFVVDRNLNILIFNQVCEKLSGYSSEEALGKPYTDVLKFVVEEEDRKFRDSFIERVFRTEKSQKMSQKTELIRKDGRHIAVADSAAPLRDAAGRVVGVVVVFRDTTLEREIDQAKTEFVSLASHQLRTPLTYVNWFAEMLLGGDGGELTEKQKKYVKEMYAGNKRMVDLVNALLNVSRIELGTFAIDIELVDLVKIAKSAVRELMPMIQKKKIEVEEKYGRGLKSYKGDPKLLMIIFQNLLSNAVKYTPEGGRVGVSVTPNRTKKVLSITIRDNGYGIPEADKEKIFTKLFRADNVRTKDTTGTGLGLYIIKSIIETSNGTIWFESEEDKGTTFFVELPLSGMIPRKGAKPLEAPTVSEE